MAKPHSVFSCSACGAQTPKWHGQCPSCGDWNTLVEERAPRPGTRTARPSGPAARPVPLRQVSAERAPRLSTAIGELDMVLGGGLVPGSLVLLGGSPGIGKSTLTNMALGHLAAAGRATLVRFGVVETSNPTMDGDERQRARGSTCAPTTTHSFPR